MTAFGWIASARPNELSHTRTITIFSNIWDLEIYDEPQRIAAELNKKNQTNAANIEVLRNVDIKMFSTQPFHQSWFFHYFLAG